LSPSTDSLADAPHRPRLGPSERSKDARPALLALVVAHQTRIAAERAATARDARRAQAARRVGDAASNALAKLQRLVLADRAAWVAERSRHTPLTVPGTTTPAERAWVLGWHLLAAAARLRAGATAGGRPSFGERDAADAINFIRGALSELTALVPIERQVELRGSLPESALSLQAQLRLFAPLLPNARTSHSTPPLR
jgi:hypothetical protein